MGVLRSGNRSWKRARDLEEQDESPKAAPVRERAEIVSDSMGFPIAQLPDFEADKKAHGHRGIEFVRDKDEPTFIQVRCDSREAFNRYAKHRGMVDRSQKNGSSAMLTADDLENAKKWAMDKYPGGAI